VLEPEPGGWEDFSIVNLAVMFDGVEFRMWYGASAAYRGVANVGYATSQDGSVWIKHAGNPLPSLAPGGAGTWDDYGLIPFSVLFDDGSYRMWYAAAGVEAWGYWRIGHATSPDGLNWIKHPDPVLEGTEEWEGIRVYNPEVIPVGDGFAMWYSGIRLSWPLSQVGYAISPDGLHWGKWPDNPILEPSAPCTYLDSLSVIVQGDTVHGWFTECSEIHHASSPFDVVFFDAFETGDCMMWSNEVP